jgi:hypothetical protein
VIRTATGEEIADNALEVKSVARSNRRKAQLAATGSR